MRGLGARAPVPLLLLVTMFFWGAAFNVTEVALDHTTPAFTAFSRGAFGFLVLLPFLSAFGSRLPRTLRLWGFAAAMGFGGTTLSLAGARRGHAPGRAGDRGGPAQHRAVLRRRDRQARPPRARHGPARARPRDRLHRRPHDHPRRQLLERRGHRHRRGPDPARSDRIRLRGPARCATSRSPASRSTSWA